MEIFTKSDSIAALASALSLAQGKMEAAKKDADNPFFHSKYADLASVWDACREPLSENKLAIIQLPGKNQDGYFVDTILAHGSGEFICGRLCIKPVKDDPQGLGSAITYARRYALQAMVGIAPEEDDGEDAMGRKKPEPKSQQRQSQEPPRDKTSEELKEGNIQKLRKLVAPTGVTEERFSQEASAMCEDNRRREKFSDFSLEELRNIIPKYKAVVTVVQNAVTA